jgi:hypothetical protein
VIPGRLNIPDTLSGRQQVFVARHHLSSTNSAPDPNNSSAFLSELNYPESLASIDNCQQMRGGPNVRCVPITCHRYSSKGRAGVRADEYETNRKR